MKNLLIILYTSFSTATFAQTLGQVEYQQIINLNPKAMPDETGLRATLYLADRKSLYIHSKIDSLKDGKIKRVDVKGSSFMMSKAYPMDNAGQGVFKDFDAKHVILRKLTKKSYLISDTLPTFKWVLQNEKRVIGGINCQKATTHYRGRNYIAWFAPSLPYSEGPWKFHGLPGLILEVNDDQDLIKFVFKDLKLTTDTNKKIKAFDKGMPVTEKELIKINTDATLEISRIIASESTRDVTIKVDAITITPEIELDEQ